MRRVLKAIVQGEGVGDISTIEDAERVLMLKNTIYREKIV